MEIKKYGRRAWGVYDHAGKLIVVTMYKKGAEEVMKLLKAASGRRKTLRRPNPAPLGYLIQVTMAAAAQHGAAGRALVHHGPAAPKKKIPGGRVKPNPVPPKVPGQVYRIVLEEAGNVFSYLTENDGWITFDAAPGRAARYTWVAAHDAIDKLRNLYPRRLRSEKLHIELIGPALQVIQGGRKPNPVPPLKGWVVVGTKGGARGYFTGDYSRLDTSLARAAMFVSELNTKPIIRLLTGAPKLEPGWKFVAIKIPRVIGKNPVPPSSKARLNEAARRFEDFTGHRPEHIDVLEVPDIDTAFRIGDCDFVGYTCKRDGVVEHYIHRFKKKARPHLASAFDGRQLLILGGGYQFTDRGIVDD